MRLLGVLFLENVRVFGVLFLKNAPSWRFSPEECALLAF